MSTASAATIRESQLQQMAAEIRDVIPGAEVRLFGSHAQGDARPDSDIDLLITASDGIGLAT
jgi:predicted nucleotidyltransferase